MYLAEEHQAILDWYQAHGRLDLPWRTTNDVYHIYISELMLQQTQVKTVLERFYHPFLARFPTLQSLADATEHDVLKAWEGLGYYTRARNLHTTAQLTAPNLPDNYEALIALPGIGKNTAHAILAFGFHQPVAVMEANVRRVLHRYFARTSMDEKTLWQRAAELVNRDAPYAHNQAMMDIGAMVCTKRNPLCEQCPLSISCKGQHQPEAYPAAKATKPVPVRERTIIITENDRKQYYLYKRETQFLGGLYGFPELEHNKSKHSNSLGTISHQYSHFRLEATLVRSPDIPEDYRGKGSWFHKHNLAKLPLSKADSKVLAYL